MRDWQGWLLETGVEVAEEWGSPEMIALAAARKIEQNIIEQKSVLMDEYLKPVRRAKNALCFMLVLVEGHNPWHENVGREEWMELTEIERAKYEESLARGLSWAKNLGWAEMHYGRWRLTVEGQEVVGALTLYNE